MSIISAFHYRPEIDGLRAIAVLAVVFFHTGFVCPGGYVGVDVFFVISGFLITSLIWTDLERGRFAFVRFWERRARRIIPALIAVTVATLVAGCFLLLPLDLEKLGKSTAAQAVFAANIYYYKDSNYFSGAADEKPLLHTWSLAVEEQFYLVVPFLLWGIFHSTILRRRSAVISILFSGLILSLAMSVYFLNHNPPAAFYFLNSRAWELLTGSLIAFLPASPSILGRRSLREILALSGLASILVPIFSYTRETPFPGIAALPPCLGTALLIWATGFAPTFIGSLLSTRPIVFTGLISYSLYLWHWPFLAFSKYFSPVPLPFNHSMAMVCLGLLFAIFFWKYLETPFRKKRMGATRKSMFAFAGSSLAFVLCCGLVFMFMHGFPQRLSPQAQKFAESASDKAFLNQLTTEDIRAEKLVPIGVLDQTMHPSVLVWGDSHAMSAMPAFDSFLKEKGLAGRAATHSSVAPVLDWAMPAKYGLKDAQAFNDSVLSYIQNRQIHDVVLVAYWGAYLDYDKKHLGSFNSSLLTTVRRLDAIGARSWIALDVPIHPFSVPKVLSLPRYFNKGISLLGTKPTIQDELQKEDPIFFAKIEEANGRILDVKSKFLDPTGRHYIIQANGAALYYDGQHLTTKGATHMLLPLLRDSMTIGK